MSTELFPLPLSPFEYYYWCDDRPEYPTTFPIDMVFSPPLERGQFERALELTVLRHPLLSSLVAADGRKGPNWIGGGQLPKVDWAGQESPITHADGERIDLGRMPGLRIWARSGRDSTRLLFVFHHACCDGLGAFRFIGDLMMAYARQCGGSAADLPLSPLDPMSLRAAREMDLPTPSFWTTMRDWWVGGRIWTKFACQTPVPLAEKADSAHVYRRSPLQEAALMKNERPPPFTFSSRPLDAELISRIRLVMKRTGCTVNDIFLCGLFLAARAWNAQYGRRGGSAHQHAREYPQPRQYGDAGR